MSTDSRTVQPGQVFFAIRGDQFDGHQFIEQAVQNGTIEVVAELGRITPETRKTIPPSVAVIEVASPLEELRKRASAYRSEFNIPVVAVVGSVGKTTSKELIASILSGKFSVPGDVLKTQGSQNGFLGIPLTLFNLNSEVKIAVIEVGIDEIGAMESHMNLVRPNWVILTAIGPEHLHQLQTVEIAAREELKAFEFAARESQSIIANLEIPEVLQWWSNHPDLCATATAANRIYPYTFQKDQCPVSLQNRCLIGAWDSTHQSLAVSHLSDKNGHAFGSFSSPLPGEHNAKNLLGAITLAHALGLTADEIRSGLANFKTAFGRTEISIIKDNVTLIGDYYNSNPTSATAALRLLKEKTKIGSQSHALLGDMLELGPDEENWHRSLATELQQLSIDHIYLIGPRMQWLNDELKKQGKTRSQFHFFQSSTELIPTLERSIRSGDTLLIKGSRGMRLENIADQLK